MRDVIVYFTNGDKTSQGRYLNISVNGGAPQRFAFPTVSYGNWDVVGSMTVTLLGFVQGGNNTVQFLADGTHQAPDLDWIEVMPGAGQTIEAETGVLTGSAKVSANNCTGCSSGMRVGTIVQTSTVTLANINRALGGAHSIYIYYSNGSASARSLRVSVNGGTTKVLNNLFPSTGSFTTFGSTTVSLSGFVAGPTNSITFSAVNGSAAPDLDFIQVK